MNFLIENTNYSLLIYFLIKEEKDWKDTTYILNYQIPLKIINKLSKKINKNKIYTQISPDNNFFLKSKNYYFYYLKMFFKLFFLKDIYIYGNDDILFMIPFKNKEINLIEDGTVNYVLKTKKDTFLKKIKKKILLAPINYKTHGLSKRVKKIYLTGLAPIPKEIVHKVELINLKELWDKKSFGEQREILDIFSFDLNIKESIKGRDIILFTQPLSEDGIITEDEKIEIYLKIANKYPHDRLIIKTHPREKTNYKEIFSDNLVLDNPFPFEILNLLDVKFNKAVTLFSTAALGLGENVEVDFYGTEVNQKILNYFGSRDNIMKRNCYLKLEER